MGDAADGVAVVTDSTASLPPEIVTAAGIVVVPLHVAVDGTDHREGIDLTSEGLVDALRAGSRVTTSQPGPDVFAREYARLAARGAREIVSVHLSGELSGTVTSAQTAAQTAAVPVHVVDSRTVGMALGLGVLAAADVVADGGSGTGAARAAAARSAGAEVLFAVDSLEYLRRGGRLGTVAAALGTVLGLRPVLGVREGRLEVVEKVRTSSRARERILERTAAEAQRRRRCSVAVHHLGDAAGAEELAARLAEAAGPGLQAVHVAELSAVLGAHTGPGVLATVVADA